MQNTHKLITDGATFTAPAYYAAPASRAAKTPAATASGWKATALIALTVFAGVFAFALIAL